MRHAKLPESARYKVQVYEEGKFQPIREMSQEELDKLMASGKPCKAKKLTVRAE